MARQWRAELIDIKEVSYEFVKRQMDQGVHEASFMSGLIDADESDATAKDINKWSAMSLYAAGADTVSLFRLPILAGFLMASRPCRPLQPFIWR